MSGEGEDEETIESEVEEPAAESEQTKETAEEAAEEPVEESPEPEPEPEEPKGPDLLLEALQREVKKTDSFVKPSQAQSLAAKPVVAAASAASFDTLLSTAGGLDEEEAWAEAEGLDGLTDSLGFYVHQLYGMPYGQTDQYRIGMRRMAGAILVVEVAWADEEIEELERIMLEPTIEALSWSPESKDLLINMVTYAPPQDLFSTARQVMAESVKLEKSEQPFDRAKLALLLYDVGRLGKKKVPKKNRKVLQGIFREVDFGDEKSVKEIKSNIKVK